MTDNDFDTQRTELANRFASAGAEFLGQMPLAAAALAEVPNTQPQQYAMVGEPKAIRALLPSDDIPARRMRHGQRPTEPLEWEPSAIANKAEVDLSSLNVQTGADIELVYSNRDEEFVRLDDVKALLTTPPATTGASTARDQALEEAANECDQRSMRWLSYVERTDYQERARAAEILGKAIRALKGSVGASTVLTDERIDELWSQAYNDALAAAGVVLGNADVAYMTRPLHFARAIEREVAAQAGQVAVPGWIGVDARLPDAGYCLATYRNQHGKLRIIRAKYARQFEIDAGEDAIDQGNCEYNEADDTFYLKAGWLECIDNWDDYSSIYVTEGEVTHWMPLPAAPSPAKESK